MFVRLGFAVAINVEPDILIIDEVLAVGDESFQRKCNEKILDFRDQGRTIVIVSHGVGQLRQLCSQIVWLDHGSVRTTGTGPEVVDAYIAEAHAGRVVGDAEGIRWGSGEIRVHKVELLDASGHRISSCHTGDAVTVRLHFIAERPVHEPVFGIAINRMDGMNVTSPDTLDAGVIPDIVDGEGHIDVHIPSLVLLEGTYDISLGVGDRGELITYDHWEKPLRFDVERGEPYERRGLVTLRPNWKFHQTGG
jgi:ABC-2 type transport system ATP-binding protein